MKIPKTKGNSPYMEKFRGKIHDDIPKPPFLFSLCGRRHSGKSVVLFNLLSDEEGMWQNAYTKDNIILVSETYPFDMTLHGLKLKKENILTNMETLDADLQAIFKRQSEFVEDNNDRPLLIIFEDITQCLPALAKITTMGYQGRHKNVDIAYVTHKLSSIPRGARTQTQQWAIFDPVEGSERRWFYETFADNQSKEIWIAATRRAWAIPHNFVFIDREAIPERMYRNGFHDPLFTPEEYAQLFDKQYFNPDVDICDQTEKRKTDTDCSHSEKPIKRRKPNE